MENDSGLRTVFPKFDLGHYRVLRDSPHSLIYATIDRADGVELRGALASRRIVDDELQIWREFRERDGSQRWGI